MLVFEYGQGQCVNPDTKAEGQIILTESKLYLKSASGEELAQTFMPLDKILRMTRSGNTLSFHVRLTVSFQYDVYFSGQKDRIKELARDIARHFGMKKAFLKDEWISVDK